MSRCLIKITSLRCQQCARVEEILKGSWRGPVITCRCVQCLLRCCFNVSSLSWVILDGSLMILQYRHRMGWALNLESKNCLGIHPITTLLSSPFLFDHDSPPESASNFTYSVFSLYLSIVVLTFSDLHSTSTCLSLAGNRRASFLTSQLKLGVSLQFPLLKKEPSMFSIYISHAAHRLHVRHREGFAQQEVNFTTPIRLSISQLGFSSPALRERRWQWSCRVDWMRCLSGDWCVTSLLCGSRTHPLTKHALTYTCAHTYFILISNESLSFIDSNVSHKP